jgi:hypothetical protein
MGSKSGIDQSETATDTSTPSAYDESFAVSNDGAPVPMASGAVKIAGRYTICPFYGQRTETEKAKGGK